MRGVDRGVSLPRPPLQCDWSERPSPFPRCRRWRGGGGGPVFGAVPSWRGRRPLRPFFGRRAGPPRFNPGGGNDAPFLRFATTVPPRQGASVLRDALHRS
ncbi:hypothetical protein MRX96_007951 [Rhipicephalus microplus]